MMYFKVTVTMCLFTFCAGPALTTWSEQGMCTKCVCLFDTVSCSSQRIEMQQVARLPQTNFMNIHVNEKTC